MEDEIDFYGDSEIQPEIEEEMVSKENRISPNRLTKYEMVRILGERTKQLKMGAKPLIKNHKDFSYEKIAEEELKTNMIPFKIKRPLPNGKYELWTLDELKKDHLLSLLDE
jgi:DNA-directed RNA polymerase subunit K/omega